MFTTADVNIHALIAKYGIGDEWDRVVALPRNKFVTGATLLQLSYTKGHVCIRFVPDVVPRSGETLSYFIPQGFVITDMQSLVIL
jgi:hypothetical protein